MPLAGQYLCCLTTKITADCKLASGVCDETRSLPPQRCQRAHEILFGIGQLPRRFKFHVAYARVETVLFYSAAVWSLLSPTQAAKTQQFRTCVWRMVAGPQSLRQVFVCACLARSFWGCSPLWCFSSSVPPCFLVVFSSLRACWFPWSLVTCFSLSTIIAPRKKKRGKNDRGALQH